MGRGGEELAGRAVLVVMRNASCRNAMGAQIVAGGASVCLVETRREGVAELAKCQVAGAERVLGRGVGFDVVVLEYVVSQQEVDSWQQGLERIRLWLLTSAC